MTEPTEAQLELLRDKYVLWDRASREGPMDLRDYNRRAADALKAVLSVAQAEPAVPLSTISEGWRPIETAPKDGTVILLGRLGKDAVFSGWWQDGTEPCGGNGPGWIDGATDRDEDYIVYAGITHWMPLPAPPALSEGGPYDRSDDQPA